MGAVACPRRSGQSLRVVAGLAGMSKDTLNRIERGERSPTLNEIRALADALQISVSELTRLPVPAPANGHTDSTIAAVDLALMAVSQDLPDGQVLPVGRCGRGSRRRWTFCAVASGNGRSAPLCPV